jgi:hypothetical protein
MYHTIEFNRGFAVDLEVSSQHRLGRMHICRGPRLQAQISPYVVETDQGPTEMADLYLADGLSARRVPFYVFKFVDWAPERRLNHST